MHFSCESCRATLHIADEKVKGKRLVVRCKRCGAKINIADPALGPSRASLVPGSAPGLAPAPVAVQPQPRPVQAAAPEAARAEPQQGLAGDAAPGADSDTESTRAMDTSVLEEALRASKAEGDAAAQAAKAAEPVPAPLPPRDPPVWFAMIGGKQVGPISRAELGLKTAQGAVGPRTYVWREGMGAWQRGKDVSELSALFAPPPDRPAPPPPVPAPAVPRAEAPAAEALLAQREPVRQTPAAVVAAPEPVQRPVAHEPVPAPAVAAHDKPAVATNGTSALELARWAETELGKGAEPLDQGLGGVGIAAPSSPLAGAPGSQPLAGSAASDPFARVPDGPHFVAPGRGETTGELIARSGVQSKRRHVGLVAGLAGAVLLVAAILYGVLSREQTLPAAVTTEVVRPSIGGTGDGSVGGLIKTDKEKAQQGVAGLAGEPTPKRAPRQNTAVAPVEEPKKPEEPKLTPEQEAAMKALDNERGIGSHGPKAAKEPVGEPEVEKVDSALSLEDVQKKVAESKTAFKKCIDEAMNRNPRLRVGKINIATRIAPTGKVIEASIDKKDVQESPLGQCLIRATQRMVFAPFAGEAQDAVIPLHVAGGQ